MKASGVAVKAPCGTDVERLTKRAARHGFSLDPAIARALAPLGALMAARKVDAACQLIGAARADGISLGFRAALRRIEQCGGDVHEASRRMLTGGVEQRDGVSDAVEYAADRGVVLAPHTIYSHFKKDGRDSTIRYVDKLAAIMDAAAIFKITCTQARAGYRLRLAEGDAESVIAGFAAEHRRRSDRQTLTCRMSVTPRALNARASALAGCGCPRCVARLAKQLEPYITKMIGASPFAWLEREEARAEANLELIKSIETWPGGNFTGWYATRFDRRMKELHRSSRAEPYVLSLDAADILSEGSGSRTVSLAERISSLSCDPLTVVIQRERLAAPLIERRRLRAESVASYTNDPSARAR